MHQEHSLSVGRLETGYVRLFLVTALLALVCVVLLADHLWRGTTDPQGELSNKHEWSLIQTAELRGLSTGDSVRAIPRIFDNPDHDAIVLPNLDGGGSTVMLSNAVGIPRIKTLSQAPLRRICPADYAQIKDTVRLNTEVDALLKALTAPDCGTARPYSPGTRTLLP